MGVIDLPVIVDPGDALSQPTRARLFGVLSELRRPAGTGELAERLGLHRGITRGLLDVLEPGAKLAAFVPHDPDRAGCEIELRGAALAGEGCGA